jgi:hypothetical protein
MRLSFFLPTVGLAAFLFARSMGHGFYASMLLAVPYSMGFMFLCNIMGHILSSLAHVSCKAWRRWIVFYRIMKRLWRMELVGFELKGLYKPEKKSCHSVRQGHPTLEQKVEWANLLEKDWKLFCTIEVPEISPIPLDDPYHADVIEEIDKEWKELQGKKKWSDFFGFPADHVCYRSARKVVCPGWWKEDFAHDFKNVIICLVAVVCLGSITTFQHRPEQLNTPSRLVRVPAPQANPDDED